jgi:hypothetical protein
MSKPTRWALVSVIAALACSSIIAACASGGSGGGGDDMQEPMDAPMHVKMDGSVTPPTDGPTTKLDAGVIADAFKPPPDAPPGSLFCMNNAQCTVAGECCVTLGGTMGFCAPGTVVLGQCVPIN